MKSFERVLIVAATRTPMGGLMGCFNEVPAATLGAVAIEAALQRSAIQTDCVDQVIMGCVLAAGQGQAPARQAALQAGLAITTGAVTINKMCGSGMKAVMDGHDQIIAGSSDTVIAGGMENMSRAPYLLEKGRQGMRMGHGEVIDSMFRDGLEDAYEGGLMGAFAQASADEYHLSREAMDGFAISSLSKANTAVAEGWFEAEIAAVQTHTRRVTANVDQDEQPGKADPQKITALRPAFTSNGTLTAANSSSISDGAAALILMSEHAAKRQGVSPLCSIVGHATYTADPAGFVTAPIGAVEKLLAKVEWHAQDVDLWEINEAFAAVTMIAMQALALDENKVNVNGGACALGHPIGCSGARILVTMIHALKRLNKRKGIAAICIGGGEATAIAVELC